VERNRTAGFAYWAGRQGQRILVEYELCVRLDATLPGSPDSDSSFGDDGPNRTCVKILAGACPARCLVDLTSPASFTKTC